MDKTFRLSRVKAGFTDPRRPTVFFYPPGSYVFFVLFVCLPPPHTVDGSYILARATPVVPVVSLALVSYRRKKIQLQLYSQVVVPRIVAAQRKGMSMQALYASRPRPCRGARQYNERKRCHTPEKGHNGHNKGGETVGWDGCSTTTKMKRTVLRAYRSAIACDVISFCRLPPTSTRRPPTCVQITTSCAAFTSPWQGF